MLAAAESVPAAAVLALARAPLSSGGFRVALAVLAAAARGECVTVADLGRLAGVFERAARAALSAVFEEGGALAPWVRRSWHGRAWRFVLVGDDGTQAALPFERGERQAALPFERGERQAALFGVGTAAARDDSREIRDDPYRLPGMGRAGLPGMGRAGLPGMGRAGQPPHTPLGVLDPIRSCSPLPSVGESEGRGGEDGPLGDRDEGRAPRSLPPVPDEAIPWVAPRAAVLAAEGARAAEQRAEDEGRPFKAADADEWGRALLALARKLGSEDAPDLARAGALMLAGLTVGRRPGFDGWRAILSVAPRCALGWRFRGAMMAGWGVAPSAVPRRALAGGRDPLGVLAGIVPEPDPTPDRKPAKPPCATLAVLDDDPEWRGSVWSAACHPAPDEDGQGWALTVPNQLYLDFIRGRWGAAIDRALGAVRWYVDPSVSAGF